MANSVKKEFAKLLAEKLKDRNIDAAGLAKKTRMSAQHLSALAAGDEGRFPPAPYLRGYLIRLGELLDFDGAKWWKELQRELDLEHSGAKDRLPDNKFAKHLSSAWMWWVGGIVVIILILGALRLPEIIGIPELSISSPSEEAVQVENEVFVLAGAVENADTLRIGGEPIQIHEDGSWEKVLLLQPGVNTIDIYAEKLLGKSTTKVVRIIYEPQETTQTPEAETNEALQAPDNQNNDEPTTQETIPSTDQPAPPEEESGATTTTTTPPF